MPHVPSPDQTSADSLIRALPDLVISIRRDGVVLAINGGHGVGALRANPECIGQSIDAIWPRTVAELIKQLARKAIFTRNTYDARFQDRGREYEARVSVQGRHRAICVIHASEPVSLESGGETAAESRDPQIERRGFLRRFKQSASIAALREKSMAVAMIHLQGITDIAQAIAPKLAEEIMTTALQRLSVSSSDSGSSWYLGQLSDNLLAVVFEFSDREAIEKCVAQISASLREPVPAEGGVFGLTPSTGIAILGLDSSSPRILLDQARAAANEARRAGEGQIRFFTDTLRLKSLARLDIARELHDAIGSGEIKLRYVGRHDLVSGERVCWVGYLQWIHPLRGEIRPSEFLRVAESTGLGTALSRAAMKWLQHDFAKFSNDWGPKVRISFGALRHHLTHESFVADFEQLIADRIIPPERLELRIAERNVSARSPADLQSLADAGVQLVVDEVGRGVASFEWLARAPIRGLQLDRTWVVASKIDKDALRVCRACMSVAKALDLDRIAPGIDDQDQRSVMFMLGCQQGSGDLYSPRNGGNAPRATELK